MRFPRQEYWSGFPSPGDLPNPGIKPGSPAWAGRYFTTKPTAKPKLISYSLDCLNNWCHIFCFPTTLLHSLPCLWHMCWCNPSLTNLGSPSSDLRWVSTCDVPAVCLTPGFPTASFAPHLPLGRTSLRESNLWSQSLSWPMSGPVTIPYPTHSWSEELKHFNTHPLFLESQVKSYHFCPLKSWLWCRGRTHSLVGCSLC